MTWTKLGDDFTDDPKLLELARGVRLLHVEAIVWSNRHTTDGKIPKFALTRISDEPQPETAAAALVDANLWSVIDVGWEIVGFTDDQPSAEGVERIRKLARARQERQRQHRNGDHSLCDPKYCHASRSDSREERRVTVLEASQHGDSSHPSRSDSHDESRVSHDSPTRPDPTRPEGTRGRGWEGERTAAGAPAPKGAPRATAAAPTKIEDFDFGQDQR